MGKRLLADRVTIVNILTFIPKVADLPLVIQQGDIILIQNKAKNYSTLTSRLMVFDYFIKAKYRCFTFSISNIILVFI